MAHSYHSAAYDLSRYEPKAAIPHQQPRLQVVEPRPASHRGLTGAEIFRGGLIIGVLALAMSMVLYSNAILTELSDQIYTENEKLTVMVSENQRMSAELEGKMSLRNIEDYAQSTMGLAKMEPYQVRYVNRCEGDKIIRTAQSPQESSLGQLGTFVEGFLEYLRGAIHTS